MSPSLASATEPWLIALAQSGDQAAFQELVIRRQSWIRSLLRRACGEPSLADDLAQQVFIDTWKKLPQLQNANAFPGWLKTLAIRIWLQHVRQQAGTIEANLAENSSEDFTPTPAIGQDLQKALDLLEAEPRICVILAYHEGMSHGEIASATDLPLGTVKSHIRRGTERLRLLLSDYQSTTLGAAT